MLKNTTKRLPMFKHTSKILPNTQSQLKETSKNLQIKEFFYTWYTIRGVINYRTKQTLKTIKFLRYELSKKFLSVLCAFEFDRVKAQLKLQSLVVFLQVFTSF